MNRPIRTLIKEEVYQIPTPKSLIIGDPMYLEQIELGDNKLKKFCVLLKRIPLKLQTELVWKVSKLQYSKYIPRRKILSGFEIL